MKYLLTDLLISVGMEILNVLWPVIKPMYYLIVVWLVMRITGHLIS